MVNNDVNGLNNLIGPQQPNCLFREVQNIHAMSSFQITFMELEINI